jgi:hypothetical protein
VEVGSYHLLLSLHNLTLVLAEQCVGEGLSSPPCWTSSLQRRVWKMEFNFLRGQEGSYISGARPLAASMTLGIDTLRLSRGSLISHALLVIRIPPHAPWDPTSILKATPPPPQSCSSTACSPLPPLRKAKCQRVARPSPPGVRALSSIRAGPTPLQPLSESGQCETLGSTRRTTSPMMPRGRVITRSAQSTRVLSSRRPGGGGGGRGGEGGSRKTLKILRNLLKDTSF